MEYLGYLVLAFAGLGLVVLIALVLKGIREFFLPYHVVRGRPRDRKG
jgi:hypothetical protein